MTKSTLKPVSPKRKRSEELQSPLSLSSLSQYRGVEFNSRSGKWVVKFKVDGVPKTLPGKYDTDVEAAEAYDAYMKARGKNKGLNFPQFRKTQSTDFAEDSSNQKQQQQQQQHQQRQKQPKWQHKLSLLAQENFKTATDQETYPVAKRKKIGAKQAINIPLQNEDIIDYNNKSQNCDINFDTNNPTNYQSACIPPTPTPIATPPPTPTPTAKIYTPLSPRTPQQGPVLQQLGISLAPRKTESEVLTFGHCASMKLLNRENEIKKFAWKGLRQLSFYVQQIIDQERQFLFKCFGANLQGDSEEQKWKNIKMWKWSFVDGQDPMLCRQCGRAISCYFGTCSNCPNYTFYCRDCTADMLQQQGTCLACECRFNVNTLLIIYRILTDNEVDLLLQTDWQQFQQQIQFDIPKEQLYQYLISKLPKNCLCDASDANQKLIWIARVDSQQLDCDEHVAHIVHEIWEGGFPIIISNCIQKSGDVNKDWTVKRIQKLISGIYQQFWVDQVEIKEKYKKIVQTDKFFQTYAHKSKNSPRNFMKLDNFPEGLNLFHVNQESIVDILQCLPKQLINYLHPYDGAQNLATYGQPLNYVSQMDVLQHIMGDLGPKIYLNAGQISNQLKQQLNTPSKQSIPLQGDCNFNNKNITNNNSSLGSSTSFDSQSEKFGASKKEENDKDYEDLLDGENGPVTVLHTDVCDAFNLCINVTPRKTHSEEPDQKNTAGCVWDIFHAEDLLKVEQILEQQVESVRTYLNKEQRKQVRSLGGMQWRIWQREGDAVLVPTGCAHQVRNLTSTCKFAWDFASASHVGQVFKKQQRMSELIKKGDEGKNDTLQAECTVIQAALAWQKSLQQL